MGFGFASLIAGPLMQFLVAQVGLVNNFIILGVIYLSGYGRLFSLFEHLNQNNRLELQKDKSTMYVHKPWHASQ